MLDTKGMDITYSIAPLTLADLIAVTKISGGDWESVVGLLERRTNLTRDQILALDVPELSAILPIVVEHMTKAMSLEALGSSLQDILDKAQKP